MAKMRARRSPFTDPRDGPSNLQLLVLAVGVALVQCMSLFLALSGHHDRPEPCPLSGVKRISLERERRRTV